MNNTELVQRFYQAIGAQEIRTALQLMAPDVLWRVPDMSGVPFAGTWRGHQGVEAFFARVRDSQDVIEFEPRQFMAQDQNVVVLGTFVMRVKSTEKISRSDWAHVWTLGNGLISEFKEYVDTAAVTAAHGGP